MSFNLHAIVSTRDYSLGPGRDSMVLMQWRYPAPAPYRWIICQRSLILVWAIVARVLSGRSAAPRCPRYWEQWRHRCRIALMVTVTHWGYVPFDFRMMSRSRPGEQVCQLMWNYAILPLALIALILVMEMHLKTHLSAYPRLHGLYFRGCWENYPDRSGWSLYLHWV